MDAYCFKTDGFERGSGTRRGVSHPTSIFNTVQVTTIWLIGSSVGRPPIPCNHLRIVILANHSNGKDTHVRGIRIYGAQGYVRGSHLSLNPLIIVHLVLFRPTSSALSPQRSDTSTPRKGIVSGQRLLELGHDGLSGFTSQKFRMHQWIR